MTEQTTQEIVDQIKAELDYRISEGATLENCSMGVEQKEDGETETNFTRLTIKVDIK